MQNMHAETGCVNALIFGITHKLNSKLKDKATMKRQIQKNVNFHPHCISSSKLIPVLRTYFALFLNFNSLIILIPSHETDLNPI